MKQFTVYSSVDGRALYSGIGSEPADMDLSGSFVIVGERHESGWYAGGVHNDLPPQPSPVHVFNYTTKQWEDPRTPETEWPVVRSRRNQLLTASDWTQLPDVPLATKEAWAIYRQALRDITLQPDPFNIVWPVPPGGPAGESL